MGRQWNLGLDPGPGERQREAAHLFSSLSTQGLMAAQTPLACFGHIIARCWVIQVPPAPMGYVGASPKPWGDAVHGPRVHLQPHIHAGTQLFREGRRNPVALVAPVPCQSHAGAGASMWAGRDVAESALTSQSAVTKTNGTKTDNYFCGAAWAFLSFHQRSISCYE